MEKGVNSMDDLLIKPIVDGLKEIQVNAQTLMIAAIPVGLLVYGIKFVPALGKSMFSKMSR